MVRATLPPERGAEPTGEYLVERDVRTPRRAVTDQLLRVGRGAVLIILVAVSLALFWVVGMMLGLL
jgi:hypothetical protein